MIRRQYRCIDSKVLKEVENLNKLYPDQEIIIELKNTKGTISNMVNLLPKDTKIRVASGYDESKVIYNGGNTNYRYDSVIYTKQELSQIISKMTEIEENIKPGWSDIQKAVYIYNTLKDRMIYTLGEEYTDNNDRTLRGLISGQNVCAGYAMIYKEMMDRQDISCDYVEGYALNYNTGEPIGGHAWNILKLNGHNIPLDLTWDSSRYHKASYGNNFFGDVDSFIKTHSPWSGEPIQNYSETLVGLNEEFLKKVHMSTEKNKQIQKRLAVGKRKDGSKFLIALLKRTKNENNPLFQYIYADLDEFGQAINPKLLYSHNNIMKTIDSCKRDDKKDSNKSKRISDLSKAIINQLLSKKNIKEAQANYGYLGGVKQNQNGNFEICRANNIPVQKLPAKIATAKNSDGTQMLFIQGTNEYTDINTKQKVNEYEVFTIDSHIHMSKTEKDYYYINKHTIYSEMDRNEMKKVPYVPSLEAIKESEEICNGYIGKYNGKGLYEKNKEIEKSFLYTDIDVTDDVYIKPTVKSIVNGRHLNTMKNVGNNSDEKVSRKKILQDLSKAVIGKKEINSTIQKIKEKVIIRNKNKNNRYDGKSR